MNHSIRFLSTIPLISSIFLSTPSKLLEFLSHQRHQNMQRGIISHSFLHLALWQPAPQQYNNSKTPPGITHWISKMLKIKFQISLAAMHCNRRWDINSPLSLHMQHQSSIIICCFLKLSVVRMQPQGSSPHKECHSRRSFSYPNTFPRHNTISNRKKCFIGTHL